MKTWRKEVHFSSEYLLLNWIRSSCDGCREYQELDIIQRYGGISLRSWIIYNPVCLLSSSNSSHGSAKNSNTRATWKVLGLAYNRRETRDKWPLGWYAADKSWCHYHTKVKLSWLQPMTTWSERQHTNVPWSHGLRPKKLYTSVEVIPAPVRVPTQWPLVSSFTSVVG